MRGWQKLNLKEIGNKPTFLKSGIGGVYFLKVRKPKEIVKKLYKLCKKDKEKFEYTFNWFPVDKWCSSSLSEIKRILKDINKKIKQNEKWKMELKKRHHTKYSTMELIKKLTADIDKPNVDMKNPDKVVRIDIIGKKAAISLLEADENLNTQRVK